MEWLRIVVSRFLALFRRRRLETDLNEDIQTHLEMLVAENIQHGMTPEEAGYAATRSFGGVEQMKEIYRSQRSLQSLETLLQDLRYGLRQLRRNPGFTAIAVITLALGIGATTAIFSVVNGVLLRPLPFPNPSRLMMVYENSPELEDISVSYLNFLDWQGQQRSFSGLAIYLGDSFNLSGRSGAEVVSARMVSPGFFKTLGVSPFLGRGFTTADNHSGAAPTAILDYSFWQRRYGGNPDIVGKSITMNNRGYDVIGVLPEGFWFFGRHDVYVPIGIYDRIWARNRGERWGSRVVGRLDPGVSTGQAQADMTDIARRLARQYPKDDAGDGITVVPLTHYVVQDVRATLYLLLGAVCLVLLIACVNVANLLLSRAAAREKEMTIRAALGARRGRVVRQLLTEGVLLALFGGGLGILLAFLGTHGLLSYVPGELPRAQNVGLDVRLLLFVVGVSLITGLLFGLASAFRSARTDLVGSLQEGSRGSTGRRHGLRNGLVVAEVGLALVLLIGAGLTLRTIFYLNHAKTGFDTSGSLVFHVSLPPARYASGPANRAFYKELTDQLSNLPGVKAVGTNTDMPMRDESEHWFYVKGRSQPQRQDMPMAMMYVTSPGYLRAMGIGLLRGRFFTNQDTLRSQRVVAIDDALARKFFPHQDPIGQQIVVPIPGVGASWTVVGVVHHIKHFGPAGPRNWKVNQAFYLPMAQMPDQLYTTIGVANLTLVVRTSVSPQAMSASIKRTVHGIDSGVAVNDVFAISELLRLSLAAQRFTALLLGIFAALALALAGIGIYGVISYSVGQRTHEIGIRMALGAQRAAVLKLVVARGMALAVIGLGIGVAVALGLTRFLSSMLFGVKPTDPLTFVVVSLVLIAVALLACYIPARRAARVDPMVALRHE
jgi:predicted permease